jgi:tetratricopeptide (TPR) repeat protein
VSHKFDRAMADAEQALRLDPTLPGGHFVRASAALNLGQFDFAIADYTETLRLQPSASADVWHYRGIAYHKKGDDADAVADYSEFLKARPDDAGMLLNRGDALRNMHEMSRADYAEAIRLAPQGKTQVVSVGPTQID